VVDPLGRIINSLPLGSEGVFDAPLPQPIARTPYARLGDGPVGAVVGIIFLWVLRLRWRRRSR
jgi:apolipoprotein N-acyltransferase